MALATNSAGATHFRSALHLQANGEQEIVNGLIQIAAAADIRADPQSIANFYVALKSRPLAILAGPEQTGKIALVQSLARVLIGDNPLQCQMMVGHARWAAHSQNVALFVEAQTRFNTDKVFALIEEALRPENAGRVFIACLTRISPAELLSLFAAEAYQQPPNLLLIGTMDTPCFEWWDADLLSQTTIVPWPGEEMELTTRSPQAPPVPGYESEFLHSCVRSEQAAYAKLSRILHRQPQALWPLIQIENALKEYGVQLRPGITGAAMIFLANAWTRGGVGLFDRSPDVNLETALDLTLAQIVLPRAVTELRRSPTLRRQLRQVLAGGYPNGQFSRAGAFVKSSG